MNLKNIIFIIYIILLLLNKGFYFWYPSLNINLLCHGKSYPNNKDEINIIMKEYISKRTQSDIDFFYLTDNNITIAFQDIIKENEMKKEDLEKIILSPKIINRIMLYKYIYNRARPSQVAPEIINAKLLDSKTASTLFNNKNFVFIIRKAVVVNRKATLFYTRRTPAYPSGHAFQAYYLAKILTKKFPEKK